MEAVEAVEAAGVEVGLIYPRQMQIEVYQTLGHQQR